MKYVMDRRWIRCTATHTFVKPTRLTVAMNRELTLNSTGYCFKRPSPGVSMAHRRVEDSDALGTTKASAGRDRVPHEVRRVRGNRGVRWGCTRDTHSIPHRTISRPQICPRRSSALLRQPDTSPAVLAAARALHRRHGSPVRSTRRRALPLRHSVVRLANS
jgi:hypothetical protein